MATANTTVVVVEERSSAASRHVSAVSPSDISIVAPREAGYEKLEAAIRACAVAELSSVDLIDVFEGKDSAIAPDRRSLTIRLTFSRLDRTLKESEVSGALEKILERLKTDFAAVLRG